MVKMLALMTENIQSLFPGKSVKIEVQFWKYSFAEKEKVTETYTLYIEDCDVEIPYNFTLGELIIYYHNLFKVLGGKK